jgi:hypothetical protein
MIEKSTLASDMAFAADRTKRRTFGALPWRGWRYVACFSIPLFVAILFFGSSYLFLLRTKETTGPVSAAQEQDEIGALYGPALVYRPYAYKLERYRLKQPDILLVGSSRVMQFAGEAFRDSVLNTGGAANDMTQAAQFIRDAIAIHKPKAVLLGLDFWWFNPSRDDETGDTSNMSDQIDLSLTQLLAPWQWMQEGNLRPGSYLEMLFPLAKPPAGLGAFAKFGGRGWDVYGRYDYGTLLDGGMISDDKQFKRTLNRLHSKKKSGKLSVNVPPSAEALQQLRDLVTELEAQSIEITLLIPPIAGPVRTDLAANPDNRLVPLWRDAVQSMGVRVFDFEDATKIGSNDCEFVDGLHGGEVIYLRILDAIANFGGSVLASAIDQDMIAGLIAANAGHAGIAELRPADAPAEIDFLDLGCPKKR